MADLRTVLHVAHQLESRGVELRLTTLASLASSCAEHAQVLHRQHLLLPFVRGVQGSMRKTHAQPKSLRFESEPVS